MQEYAWLSVERRIVAAGRGLKQSGRNAWSPVPKECALKLADRCPVENIHNISDMMLGQRQHSLLTDKLRAFVENHDVSVISLVAAMHG
jgi:hypothetical protein